MDSFHMYKYYKIYCCNINWSLSLNSNELFLIDPSSGFAILSPLHFSKAYSDCHILHGEMLINDSLLCSTNGLLIKCKSQDNIKPYSIETDLMVFIKYLRFVSKQIKIDASNGLYAIAEIKGARKGQLVYSKVRAASYQATYWYTLVNDKTMFNAIKKFQKRAKLEVYKEMLLEAYKYILANEYNKVILFATISIESLLAHTYDKCYEIEVKRIIPKKSLRMVNSGSNSKDPIWKALMDRTDFKKLLHEAPLYLLKKSILLENELLYHNLIKLYNTRNKIVHWGAPIIHDNDRLISINEAGADQALQMAIAVYNWFGITDYDFMNKRGFVEIK